LDPAAVGAHSVVRDPHHLADFHVAKALLPEIMNFLLLFICHGKTSCSALPVDCFAADFPKQGKNNNQGG
jgi:hypothetical protein